MPNPFPDPSFASSSSPIDRLIGGDLKLVTRQISLVNNQSQGALLRGAVLGMHTDGTYARVHQTGNYAAATARAILAKDADPTGGTVTADVYELGEFNETEVSLGGTVTLADVREPLRANGIYLKPVVSS